VPGDVLIKEKIFSIEPLGIVAHFPPPSFQGGPVSTVQGTAQIGT
jgi:hypothetical protein